MEPLPPETVAAVRDASSSLVDGIIELVRAENPVYAHVLGGPEGVGIQLSVEQAISSFLDASERGEKPTGETAEVWRRLGEGDGSGAQQRAAGGRRRAPRGGT